MVAAYNLEAADDLSVLPKHPDSDLVEVNKIGKKHAFSQCQEGQYKMLCQKCLDMFVKDAQKIMPTSFIVTEQIGTKFDIIE